MKVLFIHQASSDLSRVVFCALRRAQKSTQCRVAGWLKRLVSDVGTCYHLRVVTDPQKHHRHLTALCKLQSKKKTIHFLFVITELFFFFFFPQIRWTKTAGSVSDRFQDSSVFNETLHIAKILRTQGGRYYCKAENGLGSPAIKSIRVDVYCECRGASRVNGFINFKLRAKLG